MRSKLTPYHPTGTVYGTLLNFRREFDLLAPQMALPPYKAPPIAPVLYVKTANTFSADGAQIAVPARVPKIEVGATVCMVIGVDVPVNRAKAAMPCIASWVLMNDLSIPHASFFRPPVKFKCLDGFLGVGSQIVPCAQAGDPHTLVLEVRINGELRQTVDFSNTIRSATQLLKDVGEFMALRAGDVLMLGLDCLPGGGRPLAGPGDVIDIRSPNWPALGSLSNTLMAEAA